MRKRKIIAGRLSEEQHAKFNYILKHFKILNEEASDSDKLRNLIEAVYSNVAPSNHKIEVAHNPEDEEGRWICNRTDRLGDFSRCEYNAKKHPEWCNRECKDISDYFREIVFPRLEGEEEEETEEVEIEEADSEDGAEEKREKEKTEKQTEQPETAAVPIETEGETAPQSEQSTESVNIVAIETEDKKETAQKEPSTPIPLSKIKRRTSSYSEISKLGKQTERKTNVSMFKGYEYCFKEKKDIIIDLAKCKKMCPNQLDRDFCKEEREKRTK